MILYRPLPKRLVPTSPSTRPHSFWFTVSPSPQPPVKPHAPAATQSGCLAFLEAAKSSTPRESGARRRKAADLAPAPPRSPRFEPGPFPQPSREFHPSCDWRRPVPCHFPCYGFCLRPPSHSTASTSHRRKHSDRVRCCAFLCKSPRSGSRAYRSSGALHRPGLPVLLLVFCAKGRTHGSALNLSVRGPRCS